MKLLLERYNLNSCVFLGHYRHEWLKDFLKPYTSPTTLLNFLLKYNSYPLYPFPPLSLYTNGVKYSGVSLCILWPGLVRLMMSFSWWVELKLLSMICVPVRSHDPTRKFSPFIPTAALTMFVGHDCSSKASSEK